MNQCIASDFEKVEKKIKSIIKKLEKHNINYNYQKHDNSIELINIVDYTNYNNVPAWQFQPKTIQKPFEVVNYEFTMEQLKLGEYEVIAVLEHNQIEDSNENIIHIITDKEISLDTKYRTIAGNCEHCNTKHNRNKTVLLQNKNGQIKQVGKSCLKEYTGIEASQILSIYAELHDIIVDNNKLYMNSENYEKSEKYIETKEYLSACIELINKEGYKKELTKIEAMNFLSQCKPSDSSYNIANNMIEYFKNHDEFIDNFTQNIKVYLSNEYCKPNGYIAYSYMIYNKLTEQEQKETAKQQQNSSSNYVGTIGEKIQKNLSLINIFSYETHYTYYGGTSYIYLFKDNDGNIYKWNSANSIELNLNESATIKGTIKAHTEYDGQKQTELTRCKIIESKEEKNNREFNNKVIRCFGEIPNEFIVYSFDSEKNDLRFSHSKNLDTIMNKNDVIFIMIVKNGVKEIVKQDNSIDSAIDEFLESVN